MKILSCDKRFDTSFTIRKEWIPTITFGTSYEEKIVDLYKKSEQANEKLLVLLQFTNSNIVSVDTENLSYTVELDGKSKKLPLSRLSRGEKCLAMCLMANATKQNICISNEMTQLDKRSIEKLIKDFDNSEYISIVPPTPSIENILKSLME